MAIGYTRRLFRRVLVPILHGVGYQAALTVAAAITAPENILLVGIVPTADEGSLSTAAIPARHLRKILGNELHQRQIHSIQRIHVSHKPWEELAQIVREENIDLLVLEVFQFTAMGITPNEAFRYPPCDMAITSGTLPEHPASVLVALRGGPYAELSLRLGLAIAHNQNAGVTALHIMDQTGAAAFKGIDRVLKNLPQVKLEEVQTDNPKEIIAAAAPKYDMVILGATAQPQSSAVSLGPVAEAVLRESTKGVLVIKTRRAMPADLNSESVGRGAISILVDRWFAENTYHAGEFADLNQLLNLKRSQDLKVSLALPSLNEQATIGKVIQTVKGSLVDNVPLLDEIILIDSNSSDQTREIAAQAGIPVFIHQQVLSHLGERTGKGEALWKSLYLTRGDIILWIDTDILNIHPRFIYGLLGPLLMRTDIQFVKGFYRRPLKVGDKLQAGGGGRVTELTARPLLNLFYPELSGVIQPLSGEYGGRRTALERLPFSSGYGVETGLLIDIFERHGLNAIAQVDLQERIHHNQTLESLSKMSFAIIQTVFRRIERRYGINLLEDVNKSLKLIQYQQHRLFLEVQEIAELERPAMIDLEEYQKR